MLSILITWCNRPELATALANNLPVLTSLGMDWEVVIANGGGNTSSLQDILGKTPDPRIRVITVSGIPFNKSRCLNAGAAACAGDLILLLDADIIVNSAFLTAAIGAIHKDPKNTFVTVETVFEQVPAPILEMGGTDSFIKEIIRVTEIVCKDGRRASFEYRQSADGARCGPGIVLVSKDDFVRIGGFNSQFKGWGFEDYDFQLRLQFAGLTRKTISSVTHITHRSISRQSDANQANTLVAYSSYSHRQFSGTFELDNERLKYPAREDAGVLASPRGGPVEHALAITDQA